MQPCLTDSRAIVELGDLAELFIAARRATLVRIAPAVHITEVRAGGAMILSKNIPKRADVFIRRCTADVAADRCARDGEYLAYLESETARRYPRLMPFIRVVGRASGKPRYYAQADHIIPRSVWNVLMFGELRTREPSSAVNVLSNLFWRGEHENRAFDQRQILLLRNEARGVRLATTDGLAWRRRWIEIFLNLKREEGLPFPGDFVDPTELDALQAPSPDHSSWLHRG